MKRFALILCLLGVVFLIAGSVMAVTLFLAGTRIPPRAPFDLSLTENWRVENI